MIRAVGAAIAVVGAALILWALTLSDFGSALAVSWLVGLPLLLIGANLWAEAPHA